MAISTDAMPLDIEKGLRAGFKKYLTKPLNIPELINTVSEMLNPENKSTAEH